MAVSIDTIYTDIHAFNAASIPSQHKELTFEEYLCTPTIMERYDIVQGEIVMSPAPTGEHQWLTRQLYDLLWQFVRQHRLGVVLMAPLDIIISREPKLQTRQPDLLFLSYERTGIRGRRELRNRPLLDVPPDLVIEILSPVDIRRTLTNKMTDYATIGVRELWLVSSEAETVEVLNLNEGHYIRTGLYGVGDTVRSTVLPGLAVIVDAIFEEEAEEEIEELPSPDSFPIEGE